MVQAMATHRQLNSRAGGEQATDYLGCLQALAGELDSAMQSLAVNSLSLFEASVSRQLVLCSQLTRLAARHQSCSGDIHSKALPSASDELATRIEVAKAKVVTLNRNYSALLKHTRRTVQMFAGLARCYATYPYSGASATPDCTWSSDV